MFKIEANFRQIERMLSDMQDKQIPFAMMLAVNDTAKDAHEEIQREMKTAFRNPTPWTQRAFFVKRATKTNPVAVIRRKDAPRGRHYLGVQARGGPRPQTGLERLVSSRLKYSGIVRTITPAKGARLNKYGNMSPGQRNQILSAIKSQRDPTTNTTVRSARRKTNGGGTSFQDLTPSLSPEFISACRDARLRRSGTFHLTFRHTLNAYE